MKKAELFSCMHEENKPTISKLNICSQNYEKTLYTLTWHGWLNNCLIDRMLEKLYIVPPISSTFNKCLQVFFFQAKEVVHFLVNRDHLLTSLQYEGPEAEKVGKCRFDRCMPSASRHVRDFWMVKRGFHLLHKEPD